MAGVPFSCIPSSTATRFESQEFRLLLSDVSCAQRPCPRQVAAVAVHSIQVATTVQLVRTRRSFGAEGIPLGERPGTRVQRGREESDNERARPGPGLATQSRSRQSPIGGGGAQLAVDTTMVSPVRMDGSPRQQCATTDGAAMARARVRKERTYPELAQAHGRARLVVVACEVGGRWSGEALSFLNSLANTEVLDEPEDFRKVVKAAWLRGWKALLACASGEGIRFVPPGTTLCSWLRRCHAFLC